MGDAKVSNDGLDGGGADGAVDLQFGVVPCGDGFARGGFGGGVPRRRDVAVLVKGRGEDDEYLAWGGFE